MSEVQSRPTAPRGRASARGGRGAYGSRGGRGASRYANGERAENQTSTTPEDEGEIGQLKKQYSSQLSTIKEMFPDWTDEDIVFALQETDGDLQSTIERITEGMLQLQFLSHIMSPCSSEQAIANYHYLVQAAFLNGAK